MDVELLSPAGSFEALKYALEAGASSVYFGLSGYNARNKSEEVNMQEWIDLCHIYDAKAYIAVNILIKDDEIDDVVQKIVKCQNLGADAFIICDLGLISVLHSLYPTINVHLSTQAGIFEKNSILYLKNNLNIKRIVLPREVTFKDAETILGLGVEIEVFCHGAMCVGYSGSCYMSSILTSNSGNRGRCNQLCRKGFSYVQGGNVSSSEYLLSSKDLCTIENIDKFSVFDCLKIEGRLKRPEYVGEVTSIYKEAIMNGACKKGDLSRLKRIFSRGDFTKGYLFKSYKDKLIYKHIPSSLGERVGKIISVDKEYAKCDYNDFSNLDGLKIVRNDKEVGFGTYIEKLKSIKYNGKIQVGDFAYITTDKKQLANISKQKKQVPINFYVTLEVKKKARLRARIYDTDFEVLSDKEVLPQTNLQTNKETLFNQLKKLGDCMYYLKNLTADIAEPCFVSVAEINSLRRKIIAKINEYLIARKKSDIDLLPINIRKERIFENKKLYAVAGDIATAIKLRETGKYSEIILNDFVIDDNTKDFFLYLPYFLHSEDVEYVKKHIRNFKGVYANNLYATSLHDNVIIGDANVFNSHSFAFMRNFSDRILLSFEMNKKQMDEMSFDKTPIVRTFGNIPLMQLNHCPYKVSNEIDCDKCSHCHNLTYKDEYNENFIIKRIKFKNCYFYLYNSKILQIDGINYYELHDFSCIDIDKIDRLSNNDFTRGHYLRGVK